MTMRVTLDWYEMANAAHVMAWRMSVAAILGQTNLNTSTDETHRWANHLNGAAGEAAVAKALNRYWPGSVMTGTPVSDLLNGVEVRTARGANYRLYVEKRDNPDHTFILVRGTMPTFDLVGWIRGRDAMKPEWWDQALPGGPYAYWVPNDELTPFHAKQTADNE